MSVIAYYVHGRGRGHAARARHIVPTLRRAGHGVHLASGEDALPFLEDLGDVYEIEMLRPGAAGPGRWRRRISSDLLRLRAMHPDALITDGDGPCLHAARMLGIPSIAVGHGLIFGNVVLPELPRAARLLESVNAASASWLAQRRVAVHFLPATPRNPITTVARPDFPDDFVGEAPGDEALAYFRDDNGDGLLAALALRRDGTGIERIRCFTNRPADTFPTIDGVSFEALSPRAFRAALPRARAVLGSAGSNLLSECVHLQRPLLCQALPDDREQAMNALLAEAAGVATAHTHGEPPGTTAERFAERLRRDKWSRVELTDALPGVSGAVLDALRSLGLAG